MRQPIRFAEVYSDYNPGPSSKCSKKSANDNNLYETEVREVDRDRNLVRIHYKVYSDKYDEFCHLFKSRLTGFPPLVRFKVALSEVIFDLNA